MKNGKEREENPQKPNTRTEEETRPHKKKKTKVIYVDDGHTVYEMDNVGRKKNSDKGGDLRLTRKERRAAIMAAFAYYLPRLLLVIGCFCLVGLLMYFWLI